jgi:tungstate transport system substrate-binding protein
MYVRASTFTLTKWPMLARFVLAFLPATLFFPTLQAQAPTSLPPSVKLSGYIRGRETYQDNVGLTGSINRARLTAAGAVVDSVVSTIPTAAHRCGEIILATTTSTQDSGLLDSLLPMFTRETCIEVKPIAVGTGAALEMARRGDADAVLVHAPEAEKGYVESGDMIEGRRIMYNDFLIIGPQGDPARVRGGKDAATAMKAIAATGSFVSRGDGSGTEKKEMELWKAAGVLPSSLGHREETGQGMGATLLVADSRQTYTLTDRGTYLAFKDKLTLKPMVEGDHRLLNIYHAYVVNPGKHPTVKRTEAARFVHYLTEPKVQEWIGQFGRAKFGEPLFVPDAGSEGRADGRMGGQPRSEPVMLSAAKERTK